MSASEAFGVLDHNQRSSDGVLDGSSQSSASDAAAPAIRAAQTQHRDEETGSDVGGAGFGMPIARSFAGHGGDARTSQDEERSASKRSFTKTRRPCDGSLSGCRPGERVGDSAAK